MGSGGRAPAGAGGGEIWAGGGDTTSGRHMGSPSVVAERGAITAGLRDAGADIGVGVEKRLMLWTRAALMGICLGAVRETFCDCW